MRLLWKWVLLSLGLATTALAQSAPTAFPAGVLTAKTIAIVNDTKNPAVGKGAEDALRSWGQFKVVDDPQLADVTLHFERTREHEGRDTQKTDASGKPTDYGYSLSFSSSVHMEAFFKDADKAFYTTKTDDSKAKAGASCVNSFHTAFRQALQQAKP